MAVAGRVQPGKIFLAGPAGRTLHTSIVVQDQAKIDIFNCGPAA